MFELLFFLFCFDLFFHIDELLFCIVKLILQKSELLRRDNVHAETVFELPFALQ